MRRTVRWLGIRFEPRDVWVGWYWDRRRDGTHHYVCLLPMVVAHWVDATPRRRRDGDLCCGGGGNLGHEWNCPQYRAMVQR